MKTFSFLRHIMVACLLTMVSTTLLAQEKKTVEIPDWMADLQKRITFNGYAQAGYAYIDQEDAFRKDPKSSFNLKRTLLWAKAQITDRWSFLFMHDFNSVVQEFYTDFRITNNKALTVRLGQFKNSFSMENPMSPVQLELVDVCSQAVTCLSGCYDPLYGLHYGRDLGMKIYGELFNSHLLYELALMNGQGINKKDGNDDKDVIVKLDYRPIKELRIVASAQKGRGHAVGTAAWNPDIHEGDNYRRDRVSFGGEWKSGKYAPGQYKEGRPVSIRTEYLVGRDGEVNSHGGYLTTAIPLIAGIDAVASADYFNRNTSMKYYQTQATAGLQYWFYKNCRLQLQYTRTWSNYQKDYNWLQGQVQVAF
jgi:hypothetical protein